MLGFLGLLGSERKKNSTPNFFRTISASQYIVVLAFALGHIRHCMLPSGRYAPSSSCSHLLHKNLISELGFCRFDSLRISVSRCAFFLQRGVSFRPSEAVKPSARRNLPGTVSDTLSPQPQIILPLAGYKNIWTTSKPK